MVKFLCFYAFLCLRWDDDTFACCRIVFVSVVSVLMAGRVGQRYTCISSSFGYILTILEASLFPGCPIYFGDVHVRTNLCYWCEDMLGVYAW